MRAYATANKGGHVLRDLPLLVDQPNIDHPGFAIEMAAPVGEDPSVLASMADYCVGKIGASATRKPSP